MTLNLSAFQFIAIATRKMGDLVTKFCPTNPLTKLLDKKRSLYAYTGLSITEIGMDDYAEKSSLLIEQLIARSFE
ncbi:MAG: hypothetical protein ACFB4I_06505 [Cyanophyceae cyanobacterium]